jgi:hypothetical protein
LWLTGVSLSFPCGQRPQAAFACLVAVGFIALLKSVMAHPPRLSMETESIRLLYTAPPLSCGLSLSRCKKADFICQPVKIHSCEWIFTE